MRKLIALVALLATAAVPGAAVAQQSGGGLRYSITVTKFENEAGWHGRWDLGDAWGTVLTDLLNQTGKFIVLGEKDMRQEAMAEQDFAASGRTAGGNKAPVTGQMTPAQLLVKGAITHVQDSTAGGGAGLSIKGFRIGGKGGKGEVNATIYVVDSTTGQVLASKSVVGESTQKGLGLGYSGAGWGGDVNGFKKDNVGQLPKIPWTGTVVLVKGDKVYVNRGSREGVGTGQVFVVGQEDVIRDPDTGEILDRSMNELARLQVDQVREKLSICSVVKGDASAVKKGMAIQLPGR